jgi:hypothetical protein
MGKLELLARSRFGATLTPGELKLMRAAPNGDTAVCGPNDNDEDPNNDPSKADQEWHEREIRAEVIRWLCVDEKAKYTVDPMGISVYGAKITGMLVLSFVVLPFPIVLSNCRLMGAAVLTDAQLPFLSFVGSWVRAIVADRLDVKGSVFLRNGFHAEGEVRLSSAQIGSVLDCRRGTFISPTGLALTADHINVHDSVFLSDSFHAEGEVRLAGAQIGGSLDCERGTFVNPAGKALDADRINVRGSVILREGFHAEGEVRLNDAEVGADLECIDSTFTKLDARSATVRGDFWCWGLKIAHHATLDLTNTSVGSMGDDEESWPAQGNLFLDGFVYDRITYGPTEAKARLRWLARQYPAKWPTPEYPFAPQPYRQLAKVLRERGDDDGAVTVLEEMERLRRKQEDHTKVERLESWVFRESIDYGYNPARAIWEILGFSALAWIIYRRSYLAGNITPTEKDAYESFKDSGRPLPHYTRFAPLVYSVENSLPVVTLGQGDKWHPEPDAKSALSTGNNWPTHLAAPRIWTHSQWLQRRLILWGLQRDPNPKGGFPPLQRILVFCGLQPHPDREAPRSRASRWLTSPRFVRWFLWAHILLGWLLATLFLAGVTGIVRK